PSHAKVILYLMTSNSSSISQIASNLGILKSNMTPIIDRLVEHGLVNKFPDPKDRRILRVELTDKAFKLFDAVKAILKESLVKKLSNLSEEELTLLDEHTLKLSEIVKKLG
ncbi:MarR family transcriptional regulator, partial [Clostridioides difficile]|nr:MarR family transcriptional regulator [Clostridioides difficile]